MVAIKSIIPAASLPSTPASLSIKIKFFPGRSGFIFFKE